MPRSDYPVFPRLTRRIAAASGWQSLAMLLILLAAALAMTTGMARIARAQAPTQNPGPTLWLGRSTGTEWVFDVPVPADFADAMRANGAKYANVNFLPKFSTEVVNGVSHNMVRTGIAWDGNALASGSFALSDNGTVRNG